MRFNTSFRTSLVAAGGFLVSANAAAISLSDLGLSESQQRALARIASAPATAPGIVAGSPVGFGAQWGELFAAVGGVTTPDGSPDDVDGAMSVGFGLGDAYKYLGFETTASIISLTSDNGANDSDSFGSDGALNFKLHTILPGALAVAVGVENVARWGEAADGPAAQSSAYVVGTKFFSVGQSGMPLAVNFGIGDNRFVDPAPGAPGGALGVGDDGVSAFGGLALSPHPQVSLIADWTGRDLNTGVSLVPLRQVPLTLSLIAVSVTERNDGETEFGGSLGYSYRF